MAYKLSILIPVGPKHKHLVALLIAHLGTQIKGNNVEILHHYNNGEQTKGYYRNELLKHSTGKYIQFIDADDWVSEDFIETTLEGIETNPDCISLRGEMTTDGQNPEIFEHSLKYNEWKTTTNPIKYERNPNHLNCIKTSIAKQFKFKEINHGEDYHWSMDILNSGLLKKEYYTDKLLYYYRYKTKK